MKVIQKKTGLLGDLPDDQFDPKLYDRADGAPVVDKTNGGIATQQKQTNVQPNIQLFVKNASAAGYSTKQINDFLSEQQKLQQTVSGGPQGADAVAEIMKQGGSDFISKGKDKDARSAIAETILKMGGVDPYRKAMPLRDLVSEDEDKTLTGATDLLTKIDVASPNFGKEKDVWGGTGPIAQFIPGWLRTEEGRQKIASAEQVRALYQQLISGKVVSEQEAQRLKAFLPAASKTETQNKEDLDRLKKGIDVNIKLFEIGKREGLTPSEAYRKYGQEVIFGKKSDNKSGGGSRFTIESIE